MPDDSSEPACHLQDLGPNESFLVTAFRHWAVGLGEGRVRAWVAVWEGFRQSLGVARAPAAVECFEAFMNTLGNNARRTIHFHAPHCPCVDADECRFLEMLSELEEGNDPRARALAADFVRFDAVDRLLECGRGLVGELRRGGRRFLLESDGKLMGDFASSRPPGSRRLH